MRKHRALAFALLTTCSLSLSGCSWFWNMFRNDHGDVVELQTTHLNYTYNDYMNNNYYQLDAAPLEGDSKLLIIPIWFTDSSSYISNRNKVRTDIERSYFGTTSQVGWQSVHSYYKELSKDKLNLTGVVSDWYEVSKPSSYYYVENPYPETPKTVQLLQAAVEHYRTTQGLSDLSEFDTDGNGYLDGVILIYGSPDYDALKNDNASNMWAYCYWAQVNSGTATNPVPNGFFWASYDFMYGSNSGMGNYYSGDTRFCSLDTHTFIHEMGHLLGLEDYYDYSTEYSPAGGFSMQDYNVGSHDPYSVMAFGWADPMIPKESCTLSLKPFQDSHDLILLSTSPSGVVSPFDEYLLLEFYTPSGLNEFDNTHQYCGQYPTGSNKAGIRLWHVDGRLAMFNSRDSEKCVLSNTIVKGKYYCHAMSNTYYGEKGSDYISILGPDYADYNILQLIRNRTGETYFPNTVFSDADLFGASSEFTMKKFKRQFVGGDKLNSGASLGWSFKVNSVSSKEAIVTVTRG